MHLNCGDRLVAVRAGRDRRCSARLGSGSGARGRRGSVLLAGGGGGGCCRSPPVCPRRARALAPVVAAPRLGGFCSHVRSLSLQLSLWHLDVTARPVALTLASFPDARAHDGRPLQAVPPAAPFGCRTSILIQFNLRSPPASSLRESSWPLNPRISLPFGSGSWSAPQTPDTRFCLPPHSGLRPARMFPGDPSSLGPPAEGLTLEVTAFTSGISIVPFDHSHVFRVWPAFPLDPHLFLFSGLWLCPPGPSLLLLPLTGDQGFVAFGSSCEVFPSAGRLDEGSRDWNVSQLAGQVPGGACPPHPPFGWVWAPWQLGECRPGLEVATGQHW